jgi:putative addiction module component (TIGR02574 family)
MHTTVKELLRQALSLDEKDRAALAGALIESLHGEAEPGTAEAWEAVIKRRVEELEMGAVEALPWSAVRERLFRGYE